MATKRLKPVPEISQDYLALQAHNPLYNIDDPDPRSNEELTPIFYKKNGEAREHNAIVKNINKNFQFDIANKKLNQYPSDGKFLK